MIVDLKEKQPIGMMPGGVHFSMSWKQLISALKDAGGISPNEDVTHIGSSLIGLTFRVDMKPDNPA